MSVLSKAEYKEVEAEIESIRAGFRKNNARETIKLFMRQRVFNQLANGAGIPPFQRSPYLRGYPVPVVIDETMPMNGIEVRIVARDDP